MVTGSQHWEDLGLGFTKHSRNEEETLECFILCASFYSSECTQADDNLAAQDFVKHTQEA